MFLVDQLILIGGILLLIGIVSSKFSMRMGLPVLVLFLAVGMLAGSEGIGGIEFENYTVAHAIGTLALAAILFDGWLRTQRIEVGRHAVAQWFSAADARPACRQASQA